MAIDADRRERAATRALHGRGGARLASARRPRDRRAARGRRRRALASTRRARGERASCAACGAPSSAPVATLPFLFEPELGRERRSSACPPSWSAGCDRATGSSARRSASAPARAASARPPPRRPSRSAWPRAARRSRCSRSTRRKRLANSLGLPELGNEERLVEADVEGELWAMMLDAKRTFDELVERHAPDERTRDAVLSNRDLPGALERRGRLAGVHGDGEAPRAAPGGPLRPAGARHAAHPQRARLPRRAATSSPPSSTRASLQLFTGAGRARAQGARPRHRAWCSRC